VEEVMHPVDTPGESDIVDLTDAQVAEAYTARTGEPMSRAYAEKIARKALVKMRKRFAELGYGDLDSVLDSAMEIADDRRTTQPRSGSGTARQHPA
jgi:hypothetical protein